MRAEQDDEPFIAPGNNRRMQLRRKPRRKLFGKRAREAFLESLACTGNVAASAEAADVTPGTIYNHRRKDPEFRAAYWMALEQSVAKLVALRVQREIERAERGAGQGGPSTGSGRAGGGLSPRIDGPPDEKQIADLVKLMAMLRDLCRNLSGEERAPSRAPGAAGAEEVVAALEKRLKAFRRRRAAEAGRPEVLASAGPAPLADGEGGEGREDPCPHPPIASQRDEALGPSPGRTLGRASFPLPEREGGLLGE